MPMAHYGVDTGDGCILLHPEGDDAYARRKVNTLDRYSAPLPCGRLCKNFLFSVCEKGESCSLGHPNDLFVLHLPTARLENRRVRSRWSRVSRSYQAAQEAAAHTVEESSDTTSENSHAISDSDSEACADDYGEVPWTGGCDLLDQPSTTHKIVDRDRVRREGRELDGANSKPTQTMCILPLYRESTIASPKR